jgi:hypothetical protein
MRQPVKHHFRLYFGVSCEVIGADRRKFIEIGAISHPRPRKTSQNRWFFERNRWLKNVQKKLKKSVDRVGIVCNSAYTHDTTQ